MVRLKNKVTMLVLSALTLQMTQAVIIVNGPTGVTAGQTSNEPFTTLKLHKESGTLVLTTSNANNNNTNLNGNNTVMLIARPTTTDVSPTPTGIAADTNLRNACITLSAIVPNPNTPTNANTLQIGLVKQTVSAFNTNTVYLITPTAGVATTITPKDEASATNGAVVGLTGGNAGSISCLFAAVNKTATHTNFGSNTGGDGIAALSINNSTLAMSEVGTHAYGLDVSTTYTLSIGGVAASTSAAAGLEVPMAFDSDLNVLYVGIPSITSAGAGTGVGACSIGMFQVSTTNGALTYMAPVGSLNSVTTGQNIIAQKGTSKILTVNKLAVMTSSDGPNANYRFKYLIVNGGNGAITTTGNQIWAIPLVVGQTTNGKFAAVTTGNFGTAATASGDLYLTSSAAAKVGNGPLPIAAALTDVQDMKVIGDAVYVSVGTQASSTSTPGVYTSQAIFDNLGKVAYWTEWHQIAPTALTAAVTPATKAGRAGLISVDAVTGHISVADNANDGTVSAFDVRMTQWQNTSYNATTNPGTPNPKGLITNLNSTGNVGNGCTAVCDLNSTTTAWGNVTAARMALFGGISGKVCFAMTGSAYGTITAHELISTNTGYAHIFDTDSDTTALDYTASTTLLLTNLPTSAGTVRSLSHSGWYPSAAVPNVGFFFAGAETGGGEGALYAYCAATLGNGYDTSTTKNFGTAPFTTPYSWQQLTNCDGIPVKIQAQGGAVYVLTRKVESSGASVDRIFRMTKAQTGAALNATFLVTATAGAVAGNVNLSSVNHIYDFVVSQTGTGHEQLTMLTNDGVYTTTATLGCDSATYTPAHAMLNCGWTKVTSPATMEGFMIKFFSQSNTRDPQTLWSAQWTQQASGANVYDGISLVQYGRATNSFQPFGQDQMINFNAYNGTTTVPAGFVDLPVLSNFYSDGARRLFSSIVRTSSSSLMKLISVPYRVDVWNLQSPYTLQDAAVQNLGAVYWMLPIAGTYMVGTSKGVVALQ